MTEHTNPGPPERCYDGCPTASTGNTEDCTCASAPPLDTDAALFARQRDDAQGIVLAVSRILGISHLADGLEHGRITGAVRAQMDAEARLTRERDSALAKAARLADELSRVQESRLAWAIEADRLDVIAAAARYYVQPDTCDGSDCDHDDDVCVHMDELHATADDAEKARQVPWLEAERERLLKRCGKAGDFELDVAETLGASAGASNADLIAAVARLARERDEAQADREAARRERDEMREQRDMVKVELGLERLKTQGALDAAERWCREASRPAIPADAEEQFYNAILAVPGSNSSTVGFAKACAVVARSWSAPVSGPDTTGDEDESTGHDEMANEVSIDAVVKRMRQLVGKRVLMTLPPTDEEDSLGYLGNGMAGQVAEVEANVWVRMDYGPGMNALADGFTIREVPPPTVASGGDATADGEDRG